MNVVSIKYLKQADSTDHYTRTQKLTLKLEDLFFLSHI